MLDLIIWAFALFLGWVSVNFFISSIRTWMGSNEAYELNRDVSKAPSQSIFGKTEKDDDHRDLRAQHGIAFEYDPRSRTAKVINQSKLSSEAVFETQRQ